MDLDNASAFMVHHVLNKNKNKNKNKLGKKKSKNAHKGILKIQGNAIASRRNKLISKDNQVKVFNNIDKKPTITTKSFPNQPKTPLLSPKTEPLESPKTQSPMSSKNRSPVTPKSKSPKIPIDADQKPAIVATPSKSKGTFEKSFIEKRLFEWLLNPIDVDEFMKIYWEKVPLHISKRHSEFSLLLSTPIIDSLLHYSNIIYTKNIDITFYTNGEKELHNQEGVARPHVVWDFYCNKCSIRLLNPQTFVPNIHKLNSELQEYFGCFVGCNAYLTPPHSQGFAPHYDDIEAFILQIEGKKLWKVYPPRVENELLPRYSSCDFKADEIGDPALEVLLEEGDILYLPRGYIHQASTQDSNHSLHITISVYQCNAWVDLLEKVIPKAMENAWKSDVEFRKGLPLDYLKAGGFAKHPDYKNTRIFMKNNIKHLIHKLADYIQIDSAIDQLGHKLMQDALPPVLTEEEKKCSVFGGGLKMTKNGVVKGIDDFAFDVRTEVCLLRNYVARFVKDIEKGKNGKDKFVYRLYYTTDNSLEYHGEPTSFLIIPKSSVKCVQTLFRCYPEYVSIGDLPHADEIEKNTLVADLWERGVIRTKEPILQNV